MFQWLAGIGLDVFKIQLLGRWSSDVVLRYVRDAPLSIVSADYRRLMASRNLDAVMSHIGAGPFGGARSAAGAQDQ